MITATSVWAEYCELPGNSAILVTPERRALGSPANWPEMIFAQFIIKQPKVAKAMMRE